MNEPTRANVYSREWFTLFGWAVDPVRTASEARFLSQVLPDANSTPAPRVLDICCGEGRHAHTLADMGYDVTGIDRDAESIGRARAAVPAARFLVGDVRTALPLGPEPFDAVICMWASFGFDTADANAALLERMRRSLAPSGVMVLDIYNAEFFAARTGVRDRSHAGQMIREETSLSETDDGARRLRTHITHAAGQERFDWQVWTPDEFEHFAAPAGLRLRVACCDFDLDRHAQPNDPRMQVVLEHQS